MSLHICSVGYWRGSNASAFKSPPYCAFLFTGCQPSPPSWNPIGWGWSGFQKITCFKDNRAARPDIILTPQIINPGIILQKSFHRQCSLPCTRAFARRTRELPARVRVVRCAKTFGWFINETVKFNLCPELSLSFLNTSALSQLQWLVVVSIVIIILQSTPQKCKAELLAQGLIVMSKFVWRNKPRLQCDPHLKTCLKRILGGSWRFRQKADPIKSSSFCVYRHLLVSMTFQRRKSLEVKHGDLDGKRCVLMTHMRNTLKAFQSHHHYYKVHGPFSNPQSDEVIKEAVVDRWGKRQVV